MSIFDRFRNKKAVIQYDEAWNMVFPEATAELSQEIQISNVFTGMAGVMPNPDPVLKKMAWNKDVESYKELLSDPQLYGAIENNRKAGVTRLKTNIENANADVKEMEFVNQWFTKLHDDGIYNNLALHALDTPLFGRMVFGIVWDTIDGQYLPTQIVTMPHELCKFDTKGNLMVSRDGAFFDYPTHPARFIVLRHKPTIANPYGEALLSRCFWNIKFKKDAYKLWGLYIDKFGIPVVTAEYNSAAIAKTFNVKPESAATILLQRLTGMARNGVLVYPEGTKISTLERKSASSTDQFERLIRICDEQNTKLLLGHSGATESTSGDKLSNDTTATDVREAIVHSDKRYVEGLFNQLIYWIHQFNYGGPELPKFSLYKEEDVDFALAQRDSMLVPVLTLAGLKPSKSYMVESYGFKDEDLENAPAPTGNTTQTQVKNESGLNYKLETQFLNQAEKNVSEYPDQVLIDDVANSEAENTAPTDVLLKIAEDYIKSKKDFKSAIKSLATAFPKMNSKELQAQIEKIMFFSDLVGRFSAKNEMENLNG